MLLAVASVFAACSDDDETWNSTSGVTVSMQKAEMTVKENAGIFNVPIEVKGNTNGNVYVKVAVSETGTNPAKEDVNYYVTDATIVISDSLGYVEIETVDDEDVNVNRTFNVTIVEAQGATIGNATTTVTLKDNDSQFYEKLQGTWTMTSDEEEAWTVTVSGADEGDADYENKLYIKGMMGYSWTYAELAYHYDVATNEGYVAFDNLGNYNFAEDVNFGLGGYNNVVLYSVPAGSSSYTTTPIKGTWSADFKTITFENVPLYGLIFNQDGSFTRYRWFSISNIKMTKK